MKKLVEWNFWDGEHGGDIEMLSAYQNILDEYTMQDFGTEEQFVTDERGFCTIFETMAEEINNLTRQYKQRLQMPPEPYEDNRPKGVFTNFNVMNISYEAGGVKVDATNNSNGQTLTFEGDCIVCTASIGVLQSGNLNFSPPLPKWKVDAVNQVAMGNYVKIFCEFEERFWGNEEYIFIANNRKGTYPMWMPMNKHGAPPCLMTVVSGAEADRIETLSDEQIMGEIQYHLGTVLGNKVRNEIAALRPKQIHVCKWRTDPRFYGAYSFLPTGCFNENPIMFHWLTEPVSVVANGQKQRPTLFFAGEAYDFKYGGQLQGAFNSGRDTALRIVQQFNEEATENN